MKVINLDKVVTKNKLAIVLGGVKHFMRTPTVQDFIDQMREAEEIEKAGNEPATLDSATKVLELTINTLHKSFPTVSIEQLRGLSMDQLNALRSLSEEAANEDAPEGDEEGEATGEV